MVSGARQTTLLVALEAKPSSTVLLHRLIDDLRGRASASAPHLSGPYADFRARVPSLHFLSISVFPDYDYDPLFVIGANFDDAPAGFWAELDAFVGDEVRAMLRCCKRPLDDDAPLYDAITRGSGAAPIGSYLAARALKPSVFHHGNRGLSRDRILDERAFP